MAVQLAQFGCVSIVTLCTYLSCFGQTQKNLSSDSLLAALNQHPVRDISRTQLLNQLAFSEYYSNPISSLTHAFEARQIADSLRFTEGEAEAFRQIGLAFWAQADIPTAIKYFLTGLKIAETNHHSQVEADLTSNIGTAYNGLGNPREALVFLDRSRQMQQKLNNVWREAAVLNNIGDAYVALKQLDQATAAYKSALTTAMKANYKLGISTNLRNIANIYELTGKFDSALTTYFKCIDLSAQIRDNRGFILSHKSIASVYLKQGQLVKANRYAQTGLDAALKAKLRAFARDLYEVLYKISEAEHNSDKAFALFKLFSAYKDSVQNLKVVSEVDGQRLRFETEKKQSEIELLKKDSDLNAERLSNTRSQLIFSVIISILTVLVLILGIRSFLRVKRTNELLGEKTREIQRQHAMLYEQNDELTALNEEILSQREEVMAQRDSLAEKNSEIEKINHRMSEVNENLELLVDQRTKVLEEQNKKLSEYAFINAHKLRAPLARVMGLVNLLMSRIHSDERPMILDHLKKSSEDLDTVVRSISDTLSDDTQIVAEREVERQ